jgi:serine protease
MLRPALLTVLLTLAAMPAVAAPERNPVAPRAAAAAPVERIVVKLRATGALHATAAAAPGTAAAKAIEALGLRSGVLLAHSHSITGEIHVARLFRAQAGAELEATLALLRADAAVEYATPDGRKQAHGLGPNDPLYSGTPGLAGQTGQWYLQAPQPTPSGTTTAAVDAAGAWGISTGASGVVIADLDTGVRFDHPDLLKASLGGKLLPGYDFVGCDGGGGANCPAGSSFDAANDGDGWDPDPSDPGDWLTAADLKLPVFSSGCSQESSSWHGTRTAGILGALTNNGTGIAGIAWNSYLLPVRVLGKCGGYDSDIIAGMLWAAGLTVAGAPANPYPARIINMSLGSPNACAASYQDAIRQVAARGVVVVVSAGNEGGPVDEPANCPGAIGVAGVRHVGSTVGYSSLGPEAALAAPAGNCVTATGTPCLFSIDTTTNLGATAPGASSYTDQINANVGTSFSAPIVSGTASLMLSVNGNLTPAQVAARLKSAARAFPVLNDSTTGQPLPMCRVPSGFADSSQAIECNCTTGTCGAGLADAHGAVGEALRPIAALAAPTIVAPGQTVVLSAAASAAACGRSVASYAWAITANGSGGSAALSSPNGATSSLPAPAHGTITVQLVVTDDQGLADSATIVIGPSTTSTAAPASAGSTACLAGVKPPAPTVTASVAPSPIMLGQSATLSWSAADATSCTAGGAWTGVQPTLGSQAVTPTATGTVSYTLTCSGAGGSATAAATLTVDAAQSQGGGGGAMGLWDLVGLGALALAAGRRRATRRAR